MKRVTVYIDESGTLLDPKDKVIVVAAVVPKSKEQIDMLLTKIGLTILYRNRYNRFATFNYLNWT